MIAAKPMLLKQELVALDRGNRFTQSLRDFLLPFALCAVVVGSVWYLIG
jgi:hypothetical protein